MTRIAYTLARRSGLVAGLRWLVAGAPVLCYHNVVAEPVRDGTGDVGAHLPLADFARQMEWVAAHYQVLPLEELLGVLSSGGPVRRLAAVTFDDGYTGVFEYAVPVLEALGLPATLFILGSAPDAQEGFWWDDPAVARRTLQERWDHLTLHGGDGERILTEIGSATRQRRPEMRPAPWNVIRTASRSPLVSIGAHSMSHRALPSLPMEIVTKELVQCRAAIREHVGQTPTLFAFPYGLWSPAVRDAVCAAGYRGAVTLDDRPARPGDDAWAVPRINVPSGLSLDAFSAWLANLRPRS